MRIRFLSGAAAIASMLSLGSAAQAANPQVEIKTSAGTITAELYADKAPKTVENFLTYVKAGFYSNTIFHRVMPGFMIQGGGFTKDMNEKPTRPLLMCVQPDDGRWCCGRMCLIRSSAGD